jgi:hypothetical protein
MKTLKKILIFSLAIIFLQLLNSCSNLRYGTNAGVNVTWGPHGPKVRPHVDFDLYNGGRF